jgi:DNA-nicking Smr family endonuclease
MTGRRGGRRTVTDDEHRLWKAVAKRFVPLDREKLKEIADEPAPVAVAPKPTPPKEKSPARALKPAPKPRVPAPPPTLAEFENRRAKRLGAGRLPIEARLDLHGLRQDEARDALMGFLRSAQANGLQHVKVITGKGAPTRDAELKPFDLFDDSRRGVLREQVPRWLASGEARALVVSFTEAARGHGGSGALYIQIRKKGLR